MKKSLQGDVMIILKQQVKNIISTVNYQFTETHTVVLFETLHAFSFGFEFFFFFFFKGDSRCSSALLIITNRWQSLAKYKIHSQHLSEVIWRPTQSFSKTKTMKLVVRLSVVFCFYICFLLQSLLQSEICLFMEWLRLEETVRIIEFQPPCCQQSANHQIRLFRILSFSSSSKLELQPHCNCTNTAHE